MLQKSFDAFFLEGNEGYFTGYCWVFSLLPFAISPLPSSNEFYFKICKGSPIWRKCTTYLV